MVSYSHCHRRPSRISLIDFWRCPIDLNHQVLAKRFPYHIRRCMLVRSASFLNRVVDHSLCHTTTMRHWFFSTLAQANPHIHRVRCVFNANHLTTPSDLLRHMCTCPDATSASTVLIGLAEIRMSL